MAEASKIEWCDHTFNPWEGCQKVGPGCDHCYADARNARYGGGIAINWGPGAPRRRTSVSNWKKPRQWNAAHAAFFAEHGRRQRVFCASLADWADNAVDPTWRMDLFSLIAETPNLDWLLLTKRIGNAHAMLDVVIQELSHGINNWSDAPWPNVWIGATVVNQVEADRDIPKLLGVPAAKRFLSMEPLLGPVDIRLSHARHARHALSAVNYPTGKPFVDWVIVGGESGHQARPMHPDWARSLRDQCAAAGVPFLFKQWGEWRPICEGGADWYQPLYRSNRIAGPDASQDALDDLWGRRCTVEQGVVHIDGSLHRITEPSAFASGSGAMHTFKVGKKAAGRLLNGIQHDGYPIARVG